MAELVSVDGAKVLAVYAHPDDPEVSCGGTLRRVAATQGEAHLVVCCRGDKGTVAPGEQAVELAARRRAEVETAAAILGLASIEFLDLPDGEFDNTRSERALLVGHIRAVAPEVVICPDPTAVFFGDSYFNHRDHRMVGWATLDACAPAASSELYFPEAGPPHQVSTVLMSGTLEPDAYVDVEGYLDAKIGAVSAHGSQIPEGTDVSEHLRRRASEEGVQVGVADAESFRRLRLA
jgi:LmbE family N-acetylglucosaminyl deacetylase